MRSELIIAAVLVVLVAGTVVHLQATVGAPSSSILTKTDPVPVYLMGAAHVPGFNDTQWRTSLEVCNFSGVARSFELAFLHRNEANPEPDVVAIGMAPNVCARYSDVVATVFGLGEAVGSLRIEADGDGVVSVARTSNETPEGTYGTVLPAQALDRAVAEGEKSVLIHLAQSAADDEGFRTNLDLLNVTDVAIDVETELHSSDGTRLGLVSTRLEPFEYRQEMRVFRKVTGHEVADGYAIVMTKTVGGAFMAAASLVDNRTGDTTTIEGTVAPSEERWLEAVNIGSPINSSSDEWYPVLARDGSFMIFVSRRSGGYGSGDLYISRFEDGDWQPPENMGSNVNTTGFESAPYLSANGRTLYFTSDHPGDNANFDVWSCDLDDGVPGPRARVEGLNTSSIDCCPVISADGNRMYICSDRPGTHGSLDVWVSHKVGGHWQEPVNLGGVVNSYAIDSPRWISDDGNTLIFDSNRYQGGLGSVDLWSVVKSGGEWLAPVNLGAPINSRSMEQGPGFVGNSGSLAGRMFFGSDRTGGHGGLDIWYSDFGRPVAGEAASSGSVTIRIPAVTADAERAEAGLTVEQAPVGRGCCSSRTSER